jgi:hypothetical protein
MKNEQQTNPWAQLAALRTPLEGEVWKDIVHHTSDLSSYQVSNMGDVRNKETKYVLKKNKRARHGKRESEQYYHVNLNLKGVTSSTGKKKSRDFKISRLVAEAFIDNPENKPYVDHINRDRLDDKASNLRWATPRENAANQGPNKGRKYKGVYEQPTTRQQHEFNFMKKYHAVCEGNHLGTFDTEEEAARAYDKKAKETWGEYAALNCEN